MAGAKPLEVGPGEVASNQQNAKLISETAAACLTRTWDTHNQFFKQRGYSKFYGNRRTEYKTLEGRKQALLGLLPQLRQKVNAGDPAAIAELQKRVNELETTSCVGLALKCLGEGFKAASMEDTWSKILTWVGRTGSDGTPMFYGTDLQKALVDLGWKSVYWNPDVSQNAEWDALEKELNPLQAGKVWNPVWGGHGLRWASVKKNRNYYGIPIQDISTLVNFGTKPPADFKAIPFFVGTAHSGYHVFPGFNGKVIEAHSVRNLNSIDNMQLGPFNPLYQEINGVPGGNGSPKWTKTEHYRSGVIVVPPGMLADKPFSVSGPSTSTPPNGTPRPEPTNPQYDPNPPPWARPNRGGGWFPGWGR